jgi:zinc D-Ala-D-Ala carboxypeptidase
MTYREPARTNTRRNPGILVAGFLLVIAAMAAAFGYQSLESPPSARPTSLETLPAEGGGAVAPAAPPPTPARERDAAPKPPPGGEQRRALAPPLAPGSEHRDAPTPPSPAGRGGALAPPRAASVEPRGALTRADGAVPNGTTVFDDDIPGVANLERSLLRALRRAATDAAADGVEFVVNSGWRSPTYQERLFSDAVSKHGSQGEAARWVATPNTSAHVSGEAVDIGPVDAVAWLSERGEKYGLCRIYSNEPWHFELRHEAIDHGCPPMYADPTHDPRMQQ